MTKNKTTNIKNYKKQLEINIGLIIFGAIFIYLIVTILLFITKPKVSIYEVREGSILRDTAYTGFILREEKVIKSKKSGYLNYVAPEGNKVGKKTKVYALSDEKLKFESDKKDTEALTTEEQDILLIKTQSFSENYNDGRFSDVYNLKNDINNVLETKSSQNKQSQIAELKKTMKDSLKVYKASDDGIIVYSTDNFEDITIDKITEDIFYKKNHEIQAVSDNSKISEGTPVYKLITSDTWTIVINLNKESVNELKELKSVKVRFVKDNITARASFSIEKNKELTLGLLTFDSSMVRYAQERYLDIELILEDESGLKIPKSSLTKKEVYEISNTYLTKGGNSNERGVYLKTDDNKIEFTPVTIYYEDTQTQLAYIDCDAFDKNIIIVKPESSETYQLGKTAKLQGVYNVNKGYAQFKRVEILCESDEYYIIQIGSDYGLSNYDHIVLDASSVNENDVVF